MSRFFMSAQIALVLIFMIVSSTKGFQNGMKIFTKKAAPLSCRSHFSAISSAVKFLDEALILQGPVSNGYGRGSKKLGVPTANLPHFDNELKESTLVNGVYFGWGYLPADGEILACVANIGKSPTFVNQENQVNIVEAHMLDRKVNTADFYGSSLRLCLIGFLRPEQKFGSFDALITQINADIEQTRQLCAGHQSSGPVKNGLAIATEFFKKDLKNPSSELLFQRIKIPLDN